MSERSEFDGPVEIRRNTDGTLDEIVANNIAQIHVEQMDNRHWWMGLYAHDGNSWAVNFTTPRATISCDIWADRADTDTPAMAHDPEREIAHAVALERERIATWIDEAWPAELLSTDGRQRAQFMREFGYVLRQGAHNADLRGREGA